MCVCDGCPHPAPVQRMLGVYAGALLARLPRTAAGSTYAPPTLVGAEGWHIRLTQEEEKVGACREGVHVLEGRAAWAKEPGGVKLNTI